MDIKKAVILAGGFGTRLKPLTDLMPKPMIPVNGRPVLWHLVNLFRKYGVSEIIFALHYKPEQIQDFFKDGTAFDITTDYFMEEKPLGTGGCLKELKEKLTEPFFMTNGDELKDLNLGEMYSQHMETGALATIALWKVRDPSKYGVARLEGKRIVEFVEKPAKEDAPSNLINAGLYILNPKVIDMIPEGFAMVETDLFPKLAEKGALYGYRFQGQWFDTGTMERYEDAKKNWKDLK